MSRSLKADQVSGVFNSVPGVSITLLDPTFTVSHDVTTTETVWTDIDDDSTPKEMHNTFEVPVAGTYFLTIATRAAGLSGSGGVNIRLVIDEGEITEKIVTADSPYAWVLTDNSGAAREAMADSIFVDLTAGTHTIVAQAKWAGGSGTGMRWDIYDYFRVRGVLVSGSGAGGTLLALEEDSTNLSTSTSGTPYELTPLNTSFIVSEGEDVLATLHFYALKTAGGTPDTCNVSYKIDSGSWVLVYRHAIIGINYPGDVSLTVPLVGLSAGAHTVKWGMHVDGAGTLIAAGTAITSQSAVWQYRGGLVPWEVDGVPVIDTPRAINIDGATVDYSVGDGKLNLALPKAVTAKGELVKVVDGGSSSTTSTSYVAVTGASGTFTAETAGTYVAHALLNFYHTYGSSNRVQVRFRLNIDSGSQYWGEDDGTYNLDVYLNSQRARRTFLFSGDLTAGSHTVQVEWKRVYADAGTPTINCDTGENQTVFFQAITGSGAGGTLLSSVEGTPGTNITGTRSPWAPTHVSELEQTITVAEGEQVLVSFSGFAATPTSGYCGPTVWLYMDDLGTQNNELAYQQGSIDAQYRASNLSFVYLTDPLTAGTHTFRIYAARWDTAGQVAFNLSSFRLQLHQYRGGLVPVTDGFTTVDKPIAQEYINASVTESGGKAIITLPKAVTASGDRATVAVATPSTEYLTSGATTFNDIDAIEETFTVTASGWYDITQTYALQASGADGYFIARVREVIDAGTADEQVIGNDDAGRDTLCNRISSRAVRDELNRTETVYLTAGTHTIKPQWKRVNDSGAGIVVSLMRWQADFRLRSGSGAGGALQDGASLSSPVAITGTYTPDAWTAVPGLNVDVEVTDGEILQINVVATGRHTSGTYSYYYVRVKVNGTVIGYSNVQANGAYWNKNLSFACATGPLVAGTAQVRVDACKFDAASANWDLQQDAKISVVRFRGGLVPHKNDNVLVQDKPVAVNYLGPGLQATNVGGQVNVAVQSAAEGVDVLKTTLVSGPTEVPTTSETVATTLDVEVVEGETVLVSFVGTVRCDTIGQNCWTQVRLRDGGLGGTLLSQFVTQPFNSGSDNHNASFTYPAVGLSAGTHTLVVTVQSSSVYLQLYYYQMAITKFRGGYVVPENVPELVYNGTSTIYASPRAGAANRLWVVLNDGKRYYADGSQLLDMTQSGLGGIDTGSEASSTWYHVYAVPASTAGVFDVTASVTDPDSGGPTGFSAWKYLGSIRNNSSGDLVRFTQVGEWFYMYPWGTENNLISLTATVPTFDSWVNVSSGLAATAPVAVADAVQVQGWSDGDSGQLFRMWLEAGNPPYWSPTGGEVQYAASSFLAIQENTQTNNTRVIEIPDGTMSYYFQTYGGGTSLDANVKVTAWRCTRLFGSQAQTQAKYQPDTKSFKGTWATVSTVNFAARPGQPSTMRLTLQDGTQRTATGTLAWAIANGVADLGYDEAGSQGNSKWLYFYAVPKSGDDNQLTVRASDNPPATGPAGYSNWKLIWSTYIDGSGNLLSVWQTGNLFSWKVPPVELGSGSDASPTLLSLVYCPVTASVVDIQAFIQINGTGWAVYRVWPNDGSGVPTDSDTAAALACHTSTTGSDSGTVRGWVPLMTPNSIYRRRYLGSGALLTAWLKTCSWIDSSIDA